MRSFFNCSAEGIEIGVFPQWHGYIRWKDAADGRTWIWPTIFIGSYKAKG